MANSLNKITTKSILDATVATADIANDAVTQAKIAADAIGQTELANNAVVTANFTADCVTGTEIADNAVSEQRLEVSNSPTNGYFLSAQSGNTGGLTWAAVPAGVGGATGVDFNDDVKARFGTGNDLEIYHDASHSRIQDTGTGYLIINTNTGVLIKNGADDENIATFIPDGACTLTYNNSTKLETTNTGVQLSDYLYLNDGKEIRFGDGEDLRIYHDGSNSYIKDSGTGSLVALTNHFKVESADGTEKILQGTENGAVELYYDNSKKLETYTDGVLFDGHARPGTNNTHDLGTASHRWRNIYTNDLNLSNEGSTNNVDGTWGNWTIQEGESDLFLKNNRSGKKYKFNLTEVS